MTKFMKKPILSFIVIFIVFFIFTSILSYILGDLLSNFIPESGSAVGMIISSIIIAFLYIYLFKFKRLFSFSNFKTGIILISPLIIFIIGNLLDPDFLLPTTGISLIVVIIAGIAPALFEEIMFRGIFISYFIKFFKSSKSIFGIVMASALVFGITHLFNVFAGAPLDTTLFQFFYTFAIGILLGAVYLRTGNLWPPIIIHSLVDISAFSSTALSKIGVIQTGLVFNISNILFIIVSIISIVLGLYYLRSSKHDNILELWEEKWAN